MGLLKMLYHMTQKRPKMKSICLRGMIVVKHDGMAHVMPIDCLFTSTEEAIGEVYRAIQGITPNNDKEAVERFLSTCKIEGDFNDD